MAPSELQAVCDREFSHSAGSTIPSHVFVEVMDEDRDVELEIVTELVVNELTVETVVEV
jgi:hypothetical protein